MGIIESSICSIVLDDSEPSDVEFFKLLTFNAASNYWNDKGGNSIDFKNLGPKFRPILGPIF